ncbi:MAG: 4-(cytidine 5'-diphospho)-2-C-methyl-D-erythritol kinase [Dehalococcoidia bacterium]|nr:4-(cytidine 5'-diphospho)-2-C-methyl-D-erythritol kinase [Dehalococcoidia bacterium]
MISLKAHAKINLTLEVLGRRADGYHEVRSVLQMIDLCDELSFEESSGLSFHCEDAAWESERSLISRAAHALQSRFDVRRGACVTLFRRVPLSAGLGCDSSDAAAVLKGLAQLWDLSVPPAVMLELAASLGSDVSFFLGGPTALASGRGEVLTPLPPLTRMWVVLLMPDVVLPESKTKRLYSLLRPEHYTSGAATAALTRRLERGEPARQKDFCNVFEAVAFEAFSGLEEEFGNFQRLAGVPVHLAGAGPALFALCEEEAVALSVVERLRDGGRRVELLCTL